jgi:hypothetical protein
VASQRTHQGGERADVVGQCGQVWTDSEDGIQPLLVFHVDVGRVGHDPSDDACGDLGDQDGGVGASGVPAFVEIGLELIQQTGAVSGSVAGQ